jgi:PAS domain S-box-containing protein
MRPKAKPSDPALPTLSGLSILTTPSHGEVLEELLALSRTVSLEMHDEEIVHAYVSSLLKLFPSRLFAVRLLDAQRGALSLVYATGRLRGDRRETVSVTSRALSEQGLGMPPFAPSIEVADEYVALFSENGEGFDVAISDSRALMGVLAVEYPLHAAPKPDDVARVIPIALSLAASLRNARLLRESIYLRDYLGKLVEHANAPILVLGRRREIRVVNRALLALTGFRREELIGRDFANLIDDDERTRLLPLLLGALRGQSATDVEVRIANRRGGHVRLLMNTASVLSADGDVEGLIAIGRDLTEIRALEQRIIHAEKLATLGQLAAGVVHELNNPLTSISVYSDYLLKQAEGSHTTPADVVKLRRIHDSADRILRFTRELLAYARPTPEEPRLIALPDTIQRALDFCDHLIKEHGVMVAVSIEDDLPPVLGVAGQLQQVLVNLITNACHAMPQGVGQLRLSAEVAPSGELELGVADNGAGISPDHLARIFEPFFSTKGEGHGTGLGLSIVRNIMELHGGNILVDSVLGQGTRFRLRFPVTTAAE